jgi:predicted metalloprotease with PDZ domain
MRLIWQRHGLTLNGIAENGLDDLMVELLGPGFNKTWSAFKTRYIFGVEDIPLQKWFDQNCISVQTKAHTKLEKVKLQLGMRHVDVNGWLKISHVLDGGAAQLAGLAPGDLLASINGERITAARLDTVLSSLVSKQVITISFYRDDLEHQCMTTLEENQMPTQYDFTAAH